MNNSWDWRIVEFSETHRQWVRQMFGERTHTFGADCRKKGCTQPAECYVAYSYVRNEKPYCRAHAEALVAAKQQEKA